MNKEMKYTEADCACGQHAEKCQDVVVMSMGDEDFHRKTSSRRIVSLQILTKTSRHTNPE